MLYLLQFSICATLVQFGVAAPWEHNNNIREFDLEWQCEQFCNRLKGRLDFNATDSACICTIRTKKYTDDLDTKHLEKKLNDLGFNFKIIDNTKPNRIIKRDTTAERLKKMFAERNQEIKNDVKEVVIDPVKESEEVAHNEKFHKLRSKLLIPQKETKITPTGKVARHVEAEQKEVVEVPKPDDIKPEAIDNTIVGKPQSEPENKKEADTPTNRLHLKLMALKHDKKPLNSPTVAEPQKKPEPPKSKEEDTKKFPLLRLRPSNLKRHSNREDRLKDLRDRIRLRLQHKKTKLPNEDGHVESQ